jgi:DeoR family transcriptional regulator, suf operon transcriptional repressor
MASSTRDTILRTLRRRGDCTIKQLTEITEVAPVSVRHHLSNLQAEGLITSKEVRHGVGRPHLAYTLTAEALELFPGRYLKLTNHLLEEIKDSMPAEIVKELFIGIASAMASDVAGTLSGLPLEIRLQRLKELLASEGFDADIEQRDGEILIRELSCPYLHIGQSHPEVCLIDQKMIAAALEVPVERVGCLLQGDINCTFTVQMEPLLEDKKS